MSEINILAVDFHIFLSIFAGFPSSLFSEPCRKAALNVLPHISAFPHEVVLVVLWDDWS